MMRALQLPLRTGENSARHCRTASAGDLSPGPHSAPRPGPEDIFAEPAKRLSGLRYLLVAPVPFYAAPDGTIWLDPLWWHDLVAHLSYIDDLTVLAPREAYHGQPGLVRVTMPDRGRLQFAALPAPGSFLAALVRLPTSLARTLRAVRHSDIVHSGVAGWPIPPGLLVNPLAALFRKPLIVVIESAFWRVPDPATASWKARLRARMTEGFARWSVRAARLAVFTHRGYRDSLKTDSKARLLVAPATWLSEQDLIPMDAARETAAIPQAHPRFVLPARLIPEKGILVAMQALAQLEAEGVALSLDIIGTGPLGETCEKMAQGFRHVRLGVSDPAPYGPAFFALLRRYQAVVVPSISDEQPRVVFDAFSQGVPVIAADTDGLREIVEHGRTGLLFPRRDARALAGLLRSCCSDPDILRPLGLDARRGATAYTHRSMHADRAAVLAEMFGRKGAR